MSNTSLFHRAAPFQIISKIHSVFFDGTNSTNQTNGSPQFISIKFQLAIAHRPPKTSRILPLPQAQTWRAALLVSYYFAD
ncbi:uncharacterized protein EAE97_006960 [Botrytis byssoidea]|uniref:Uncharacterized protein n=1 Tax=Botrytis byssoidea TaxID=139641 RepID=A0A9P5INR9_9HELO|nr:uncharacterized protein EAE97_006960 [Botrytis byssoidea]KAF7940774.1 hypothetical protein EAE97_006960 [Botrytis byssoidea]